MPETLSASLPFTALDIGTKLMLNNPSTNQCNAALLLHLGCSPAEPLLGGLVRSSKLRGVFLLLVIVRPLILVLCSSHFNPE